MSKDAAFQNLEKEIEGAIASGKTVSGVRMNAWTMFWLLGEDMDKVDAASNLKRGQEGWPLGAVFQIGDPCDADAFIVIDNSLKDAEVALDYGQN